MKKKGKISHAKKSNQLHTKLSKQGKLKKKRNKKKSLAKAVYTTPAKAVYDTADEPVTNPQDEKRELAILRKAVKSNSYSFLTGPNLARPDPLVKNKKRKKKALGEKDEVEVKYEEDIIQRTPVKRQKMLLPIKTPEGVVRRTGEIEDLVSDKEEEPDTEPKSPVEEEKESLFLKITNKEEVSAAELLGLRQEILQKKKFRIGLLAEGLLEAPEEKIENFKPLLSFLEENDPSVRITVRKLAFVSLLEVFKDLLPAYQIKHSDDPNVRHKKDVKELHDYENNLVRTYKTFLQKVEAIISVLRPRKGVPRVTNRTELKFAEMALSGLCELLETHPYFNFSKNILGVLIHYLISDKESVRNIVAQCIRSIFKSDSRGEISLEIVRAINKEVKLRNCKIHPAVIEVFLALKLKDVNLDKEKEAELTKKKLMSKKQNVLRLSKRERKREKRLKELNQELLETRAEESKQSKMQYQTQITSIIFTVYFRVLKSAPSSPILMAALEGIAKFAHCINVDFYHDLIGVLDHLILNEDLGQKEILCCVQTVFTILNYDGATINIDPIRFYNHFYASLFSVNAGRDHNYLPMVLSAAESVIVRRRNQISLQRLLAFVKRLSMLTLQVLPNGSLALLSLIRQSLQVSKACGILLDTDATFGQGIYQPELEQPEYCNAAATALWELLPLKRHYHPAVREYAQYIATLSDATREASTSKQIIKRSTSELLKEYDFSEVKFVPAVPSPATVANKKSKYFSTRISSPSLKEYIRNVLSKKGTK